MPSRCALSPPPGMGSHGLLIQERARNVLVIQEWAPHGFLIQERARNVLVIGLSSFVYW